MYQVLVILALIVAVLLAFIVLIQESKGGGLASNFSSYNQMAGVRKTTDVVEKATWTLAGLLVVLCVATTFFISQPTPADNVVTTLPATPVPAAAPTQPAAPATPAQPAD